MNTFIQQHKTKLIILAVALVFALIAIAYYVGTTAGQKPVVTNLNADPNAVVIGKYTTSRTT